MLLKRSFGKYPPLCLGLHEPWTRMADGIFHITDFYSLLSHVLKYNQSTWVKVMAWCLFGTKPLPEPMMTQFCDALPGLSELNVFHLSHMCLKWHRGIQARTNGSHSICTISTCYFPLVSLIIVDLKPNRNKNKILYMPYISDTLNFTGPLWNF